MHEANAATLKSPLFIQLKPASDLVRFTCSPIVPAVTPEFQGCELGGTLLSTFNSDQRISLQLAVFSMISNPNLQLRALPNQKRFSRIFPARRFRAGGCEFRLVPSGVSMTDVPLEQINVHGRQGAPAIEIWREDVAPAFGFEADPN